MTGSQGGKHAYRIQEVIEVSIQFDTDEADLESLGGTVDEGP
ncbi:hypothetical protein [Streptomyces platensis]